MYGEPISSRPSRPEGQIEAEKKSQRRLKEGFQVLRRAIGDRGESVSTLSRADLNMRAAEIIRQDGQILQSPDSGIPATGTREASLLLNAHWLFDASNRTSLIARVNGQAETGNAIVDMLLVLIYDVYDKQNTPEGLGKAVDKDLPMLVKASG
ncbi:hypothetical protein SISNIDRAFT_471563 [Sistotremastrum niveocremeum HHB9708]|uniref:Uncharacterized protein n=1 Tax=Sistotremastrum niveocremeum HHB9708 TaxID=1314777 RepID=A0A164MHH5_9AGAM|nr:hypothetical protein SISNIDRAFT_471563 [Sistotremastrum niveocremeum HHB9708]